MRDAPDMPELQEDAAVLLVDSFGDQPPPLDLIQARCVVETAQLSTFGFAMRNPGREMQQSSRRRWGSYLEGIGFVYVGSFGQEPNWFARPLPSRVSDACRRAEGI
jgi:hypothetical protein